MPERIKKLFPCKVCGKPCRGSRGLCKACKAAERKRKRAAENAESAEPPRPACERGGGMWVWRVEGFERGACLIAVKESLALGVFTPGDIFQDRHGRFWRVVDNITALKEAAEAEKAGKEFQLAPGHWRHRLVLWSRDKL